MVVAVARTEHSEQAHPVLHLPKADWPFKQTGAELLKGIAAVLHAPQLATSV
jgi:hypothetical protein